MKRCGSLMASLVVGTVAGCSSLLPMRTRDAAPPDAPDDAAPADVPVDVAPDLAPDVEPDAAPVNLAPVLYWRFDEESGTQAMDSSGNGFVGSYTGDMGAPAPSMEVPAAVMFPDPRSRLFAMVERQAVQLAPMPMALRPANDITVTAWYRATGVDTNPANGMASGSEILSGGNQYIVRLRPVQIEFSKRVMGPAAPLFVQCLGTVDGHLDGNWHHIAGVSSARGLKVYLDGTERCSNTTANALQPILYDQGQDLWIGRHGNGQLQWDFGGSIDEVRIYARVLAPDEIAALATGGR
jgi:concanavalin A-like lectin/glucanase superfamily protein